MIIANIIHRLAALTLISTLLTFAAPGWAIPLIFEFSGTISNTVLISRMEQTLFTSHPEWNGQQVTGTLTIDLPELAASPDNGPTYSRYSKTDDVYPYANWMSFSVNNPDGSILDISDSIPIIPAPEDIGDDAYTHLLHQYGPYGASSFYAQRTYNNSVPYPRNHVALSLEASGDNALWLTSSTNYNDVIIKPEFANVNNYGSVFQLNELGFGHQYSFRIDSLKRKPADVPEPSLWLAFIFGVLIIQMKRYRLFS